ncbi:MmcQ/YjbR family DNA-binding protein [Agromyces sp. MMS24-K17]|uniref:MmcQ/YjbR family DNA-binding protein n=1 Tax=Agromyces sp. MMS24-K17 TaxID=3372850 RepID=UPI003754DD6F
MADWEDVRRLALSMPDAVEQESRGAPAWRVRGKVFVLDRPLRQTDLAHLGLTEQPGPVLGARVDDEAVKHALIAEDPTVWFTTPHFDGYAYVLVHLDRISDRRLGELVTDAWLSVAPVRLADAWLAEHPD